MKWWQKLQPVAAELIILALVLAAVLAANLGHAATAGGPAQGYGLKIFRVESGLYPFVHVYMRTFDQEMNPLVNLNVLNIGVMVEGRAYDPRKKQYVIQPLRNREEATRSILVLDTNKMLKGQDFEAMIRAAARFIDAKRPQDQVALIALDNSGEGYTVLSNFDREPGILGRRLADLQPRGDKTRLYDGVAAAMQMAGGAVGGDSSSEVEYIVSTSIIVLGSGRDDDSAISRSDLMTRISSLKIPVPIYSLCFTGPEGKDQRNLQALSKNSFGKYYSIGGAYDTITRNIEDIQNIMQSDYVLTFRAYIPVDGGRHNVKIGVEYPTGSGIMYYDASVFEAIEPPTFPRIIEAQQKLDKAIPALKDEELYLKNPYAPAAVPGGKS
ncbi:vWA domain-containing protein [Desulfobulbus propionicus]|nr:VWA domain-containing protein [Desulfobulbus propionicus]